MGSIAYDCVGCKGRPSGVLPGMVSLWINGNIWPKTAYPLTPASEPDPAFITEFAKTVNPSLMVAVDVECWNWSDPDNIRKYGVIFDALRAGCPTGKFGAYGMPINRYWCSQAVGKPGGSTYNSSMTNFRAGKQNTGPEYDTQCNLNARYVAALASKIDFTMPRLYTDYDDRASWAAYAVEGVLAAKAFGKAIIPVVCPIFVGNSVLTGTYIPKDFMEEQYALLVGMKCDGVATWIGPVPYNPLTWMEPIREVFDITV